ncbi:hypothetical protein BDU57DRAFT_435560 [Ampelomyces quisqualis]|uniref:Uncharacterized protein n=1 Tax=Ampelomyces quisqualis TaxID=50730 RepID=A0A6A5R648_AMPQU|nr:hypothetical protein BDU57DRAFT_435560 [Ampelomyces quisqualis]
MTPAQIAGLCVAAVAAFAIAVGLMAFSVCLRRRKERKNAFNSNEKGLGRKSRKYSPQVSHYVTVSSAPEPPNQLPVSPPVVARRGGNSSRIVADQTANQLTTLHLTRPVQRNGVGTFNGSSNSSLPLSQIGVAITAELDGSSAIPRTKKPVDVQLESTKPAHSHLQAPFRPTSFETADPSDPTPEDDDDDKQLSDDSKLSPVAESPISKLRYPKVPRASNQLVPRSPRSSQPARSLKSPKSHLTPRHNQSSPPLKTHLLQNRHKDLAPLLLETRVPLKLNAPKDIALVPRPALQEPFMSPPRTRTHARSNSTESWSTTPRSKLDRKSRTQSGMWPSSPAMYDEVRPLNIKRKEETLSVRRNRYEMREINVGRDVDYDAEMNGLKSPVWVPRLTPSRKGDDLFLSVGWGGQ